MLEELSLLNDGSSVNASHTVGTSVASTDVVLPRIAPFSFDPRRNTD